MQKILIVDDEADIREVLGFNLRASGYETLEAASAEEAETIIAAGRKPDLILLDVMMPGVSGFHFAAELRKSHDIPVIFLTARSSENDMLTGFSAGGDDYVCKPFSINEVLARVKAVLKRSRSDTAKTDSTISCGPIALNLEDKTVTVGNSRVDFSRKEFEIISLLATNPGKVFSRTDFIDLLWKDSPYVIDRTVDVHIARIRVKLGPWRDMIQNKVGFGYCMTEI